MLKGHKYSNILNLWGYNIFFMPPLYICLNFCKPEHVLMALSSLPILRGTAGEFIAISIFSQHLICGSA